MVTRSEDMSVQSRYRTTAEYAPDTVWFPIIGEGEANVAVALAEFAARATGLAPTPILTNKCYASA